MIDREHRMYLLSADLREVHQRLAVKFNASLAQQQEHLIRNQEISVELRDEAPINELQS